MSSRPKTVENARDQPLVSVDVIAVRFTEGQLLLALGPRRFEPYAGELALPGVLLEPGEAVVDGAHRALLSKVGLDQDAISWSRHGSFFDGTNRDPRGATISLTVLAAIEPSHTGGADTAWVPVRAYAQRLPFDHDRIVTDSIDHDLAGRVWRERALLQALLGPGFTTVDAIHLGESLGFLPTHASNITRWLDSTGWVLRSDETVVAGRGRPTTRWRWR